MLIRIIPILLPTKLRPNEPGKFFCPMIPQYFMKIDVLCILQIQISIEILE